MTDLSPFASCLVSFFHLCLSPIKLFFKSIFVTLTVTFNKKTVEKTAEDRDNTSTFALHLTFVNLCSISCNHLISFPFSALVTGKQVLVY